MRPEARNSGRRGESWARAEAQRPVEGQGCWGPSPPRGAHLIDGTAGPLAGSLACSWDKSRQVSSGSQDVRDGDIRFWGQSLSNWGQHCLHGLPLGLCSITPVESRCREVQTLEEEAAAAIVLTLQALAEMLQHFPSGCVQRVAEEGLQGPWGQGRQKL